MRSSLRRKTFLMDFSFSSSTAFSEPPQEPGQTELPTRNAKSCGYIISKLGSAPIPFFGSSR